MIGGQGHWYTAYYNVLYLHHFIIRLVLSYFYYYTFIIVHSADIMSIVHLALIRLFRSSLTDLFTCTNLSNYLQIYLCYIYIV